jgi:serine/threonine protein kinase/class 3 adenylate cyclase
MSPRPYQLLAQIGAGADGASYRARLPGEPGPVEVRTLGPARQDPASWARLTRRLRLARLLEHPGARRILELDLAAEPPHVILAGTPGVALAGRLDGRLPLAPVEAVAIALDLAAVLEAAHKLGLGHGRLDPASVGMQGAAVQVDFTGALTHQDVRPVPAISPALPADDVASLAGLLVWLLSGRKVGPGDGLPDALPEAVRTLTGDVLSCPPGERPGIGELALRLRRLAQSLQSQAGLDATVGPIDAGPSHPPPAPRERLGRFRLLEKLGQGGMGEVYRALDTSDGSVVAVKTLLPEFTKQPDALKRFRKEARMLAEVNNPFVANLLEVNEDDGMHYLAVEFVGGSSVAKRLGAGEPLEEGFALAIISDICRALSGAHKLGIIHRDVKPENILLLVEPDAQDMAATLAPVGGARPIAKLSDFGLARHVVESESLHLTRTGAVIGTPLYLSPEQCSGSPLDPRSDVYGLGATLFHLLAGRPPFLGDSPLVLINHHCNTPPPPLKTLNAKASDGACRIVEKALAKQPAHRYADAEEMLLDIQRVVRGEPARIAAHPLRPPHKDEVLSWDFTWELTSSPEELWPHVSNTERLNRAINLPAVEFTTETDERGKVRRQGKIRKLGMEAGWEEHPFEWVEARRFGVLRQCRSGPFRWLMSVVELAPRAGGGTTLTHRFRVEPAGLLGRAFASVELGVKTRRALDRVYRRIDAATTGKRAGAEWADPFEEPARLGKVQHRRLDEALDRLAARGVNPTVAERLGAWLATAPPQEAARIRPIALARRLKLDPDEVTAACLHGAREGLLVLLWDLVCPLCRIPSEIKGTLQALREHGRCEGCNADYELDFGRSVEMIFRVHPSIREVELGTYCVGGPAHSPHVVAQVRVAAWERVEVDVALGEGAYRLRGPQLPLALEARVEPGAALARWEVDLGRLADQSLDRMVLRPGGQVVAISNPYPDELVVRLERTAARDDAVTAARAAALALFRELFPWEVLSPGRLVSVAAVTLLLTDLPGARALLAGSGEGEAFALLHGHLLQAEKLARKNGGALVKAVGEGALAAFHEPAAAVRAALELGAGPMRLAVHRGPALAATINDHLDYFGSTVRRLGEMLMFAREGERMLSQPVMDDPRVSALLHERGLEGAVVAGERPGREVLHRFGAR